MSLHKGFTFSLLNEDDCHNIKKIPCQVLFLGPSILRMLALDLKYKLYDKNHDRQEYGVYSPLHINQHIHCCFRYLIRFNIACSFSSNIKVRTARLSCRTIFCIIVLISFP